MDKKKFYFFLSAVILAFVLMLLIKFYRPDTAGNVNFDTFPKVIGEWQGKEEHVAPEILEMLNPEDILSITYTNAQGQSIHLLFDFFSSEATFGGPHSPRNCLPGAGWVIAAHTPLTIESKNRTINAGRFDLHYGQAKQVMDFWYITHFGETANDYVFKMYELLSALTFQPRDIAFVRFVAEDSPQGLAALKEFQSLILPEIYNHLPFEK